MHSRTIWWFTSSNLDDLIPLPHIIIWLSWYDLLGIYQQFFFCLFVKYTNGIRRSVGVFRSLRVYNSIKIIRVSLIWNQSLRVYVCIFAINMYTEVQQQFCNLLHAISWEKWSSSFPDPAKEDKSSSLTNSKLIITLKKKYNKEDSPCIAPPRVEPDSYFPFWCFNLLSYLYSSFNWYNDLILDYSITVRDGILIMHGSTWEQNSFFSQLVQVLWRYIESNQYLFRAILTLQNFALLSLYHSLTFSVRVKTFQEIYLSPVKDWNQWQMHFFFSFFSFFPIAKLFWFIIFHCKMHDDVKWSLSILWR
jgi:hypothetical protein